jgi:hypothetical protein
VFLMRVVATDKESGMSITNPQMIAGRFLRYAASGECIDSVSSHGFVPPVRMNVHQRLRPVPVHS